MIRRRETARLLCCFTPLQYCCFRTFSLRLGVLIWTVCDLIGGFTALVQLCHLLPPHVHLQKSDFELGLLVSAIPFAFLGLLGILSIHRAKLHIYSTFKRLELLLILGICIWETSHHLDDTWETACSFLFFAFLRLGVDFYGTYVAWSSVVKLRSSGSLEADLELKGGSELTDVTNDGFLSKGVAVV